MSGGTDTLKGANVSKCIPRPLLANSCEVLLSPCGKRRFPSLRQGRFSGGIVLGRELIPFAERISMKTNSLNY